MAEVEIARLRELSVKLAEGTNGLVRRDFLSKLRLGREPRIKVLRGFRGVGKTTALLHLSGENSLYFSMDSPMVELHSLYDIGKAAAHAGYKTLLIDEAHTYANWKKDTKALYDEFPDITIVVSGSAPLAFEPERRYEIIDVSPLSLLEFGKLAGKPLIGTDSWADEKSAADFAGSNPLLREHFAAYMEGGGFPAYFKYCEKTLESIFHSMKKSIREDAVFASDVDGETIAGMEKAVVFLASSGMGGFSINSLSNVLALNRYKTYLAVETLEAMKIVRLVRPYGKGAKAVRGDPKLMFFHPNLRKAACLSLGISADIGAIREELAVFFLEGRGWKVNTIKGFKKSPDYIIERKNERMIVEIGGEKKGRAQLAGFPEKKTMIREQGLIALGMY